MSAVQLGTAFAPIKRGNVANAHLIAEADRRFSRYIRNRGASFGMNACFTCGVRLPVEELQCGHYRSRRHMSTRWHPFNCWPQCHRCNVELNGNLKRYRELLCKRYGEEAVEGIEYLSQTHFKPTRSALKEIIDKYSSYK